MRSQFNVLAADPLPITGGYNIELPPALSLGHRKSSMQYTSKKARKQNWFNYHRTNKKIETEMLLKGFDQRKESRSFLLSIKGVNGIPIRDIGSDKPPA